MLRAMIVDDEELSVQRLSRLLSESGKVSECHTFLTPMDAYEFARTNSRSIDIAFLDISMPDMDGMELSGLLQDLDGTIEIVFVTSYDEYAVRAFELSALDYLLKPATAERLGKTLDKIQGKREPVEAGTSLEVRLLGGLRIFRSDEGGRASVKLRSPKTEELFALLICSGTVSREEIADTLWSGADPDKAFRNLNTNLYYIRKALGEDKERPVLVTGGHNEIRIEENGLFCDLYEVERLLRRIKLHPANSEHLWKQVEELYAGPLLRGKPYEWAFAKGRQLEREYAELMELTARGYLRQKRFHQALRFFNGVLKMDPLREDIHREVILLYAGMGRKNEASRHYRDMENTLRQDWGIAPQLRWQDILSELDGDLNGDFPLK